MGRLSRAVGTFVTSTCLTVGGIAAFAEPAYAACTVNLGTCQPACVSTINTGACNSGNCAVNVGTCDGGTCTVNVGNCGAGCTSLFNAGNCGNPPVNSCVGTGQATLATGIAYAPLFSFNVAFEFSFNCANNGQTLSGFGVLESASCGRSVGTGFANGIGPVSIQTSGSMLLITGSATGGGNATPIPDTSTVPFGNSCSNGTARVFQLTGGAVW